MTTVHETEWCDDDEATKLPVGGNVAFREWKCKTANGDLLGAGSDINQKFSRLDYFLMMFPHKHIQTIVMLTNRHLATVKKPQTSIGEILKFFGVLILTTKFEFGSRRMLWSIVAPSKYVPAPCFGKTGMVRNRFDDLWRYILFSDQPAERPDNMSHEKYRWCLVDDFVKEFNDHREHMFIPSDWLCADESISRWYGQGGHWINMGLPMYIAIDRKPENGCEIQNSACGRSGVMLRLKLVKTAEECETEHANTADDGLLHGTRVLKALVAPWTNSNRIVCADLYFASVGCCEELKRIGLRFIGVVKTATKRFPMQYLSQIELENRGEFSGLVCRDHSGDPKFLSFVWMDRERRYFISSASSLQEGEPYSRKRWRQVSEEDNAEPENVELTIPQPKAAEIYYAVCGKIDQHNRHRQATLQLETKLATHDWSKRVNLSILAITMVDTWLVYKQCTHTSEIQKDFYGYLAEELIDNAYDTAGTRQAARRSRGEMSVPRNYTGVVAENGMLRSGASIHLTPTKKMRRVKGNITKHRQQRVCRECKKFKTKHVCSVCHDENLEHWLCHTDTGRSCFATHVADNHDML